MTRDLNDRAMEDRVTRKVLQHWIPLLVICYIVCFLDRTNISIAALQMNEDIGISASVFGLAAGIFFWTYALAEVPSNFALSKVGFRLWVPRIMVTWGIVVIAMSAIQGGTSFLVTRVLLGLAEAGFSPAMIYFISRWLPRRKRGIALSLMFTSSCFAGLLGPVMAYVMVWMDGLGGMAGWRWLFIVTGIPAIVMAFFCARFIRNDPEQGEFLSEDERSWLVATLARERAEETPHSGASFFSGLRNVRVLLLFCVFFLFELGLFGYQFWLPQMLATFDFSTIEVGWISALPALIAIVPMLVWSRHSDRTGERIGHFVIAAAVTSFGFFTSAVFVNSALIAIVGFCIAGLGLYVITAIFWTIPMNILTGASLAAAIGLINGLGSVSGYFGPQLVGVVLDRTGSFAWAVAIFGVALLLSALGGVGFKIDQVRSRRRTQDQSTQVKGARTI